ncbi:Kef-type potassium/proton antiporter, CPA2 family [Turneriella parva DSM 21527]|uniref:Kef-type potassium/proton antiporter, CPA2 family n=2 Tax=Turneriella TaxID=338321 RepID=I4BB07_TURPD|nr:Kef-type potassium/proton antiporter, CPA2 family [Turneriella parva DSM 21527]
MLLFMAAAVVAVPLATRLGLGSILGYLIAGAVIGPSGLKLIWNVSDILTLSEFGVVLLLFIIGLELRPGRLWNMRRDIFGFGLMQIIFCMLGIGGALLAYGVSGSALAILSFGSALSSTAFALQLLREKHELNTSYGRAAFAVLLFQDIAVIPVLVAIPFLTTAPATPGHSSPGFLAGLGALAAVLVGGKYLVRPFFRVIVRAESRELFTAASLLMVFSVAALMEHAGFSMAFGTFVAGVLLSESEYRHELEASIEPFKGLLLGLFFMAVGMSIDFSLLLNQPLLVFAAVAALMAIKVVAIYGAGQLFRYDKEASRNIAFLICQGGEFAFVLFKLAAGKNLFTPETAALANVVVAVSLVATPFVFAFNQRFLRSRFAASPWKFDEVPNEGSPVILAGFGRYGQIIGRMLRLNEIDFTALEVDYEQVQTVRKFGSKVYYGDASRLDLLEAAGAANAKIFVLAVDDIEASVEIARIVKQHFPHLKLIARARNRAHAHELIDVGVDDLRRETLASSLETAHVMLRELGFSEKRADQMVRTFRKHDEEMLHAQRKYRDNEKLFVDYSNQAGLQLAEVFRQDAIAEEKD